MRSLSQTSIQAFSFANYGAISSFSAHNIQNGCKHRLLSSAVTRFYLHKINRSTRGRARGEKERERESHWWNTLYSHRNLRLSRCQNGRGWCTIWSKNITVIVSGSAIKWDLFNWKQKVNARANDVCVRFYTWYVGWW